MAKGEPMKLASKIRTRERILTMGVQGVGKSKAILDLARYCPDNKFNVVDCEVNKYDRFLDTSYQDVAAMGNVIVEPHWQWAGLVAKIAKICDNMDRDDWLVLDPTTPSWDWVQSWFIEMVHGENIEDYFMDQRKKKQQQRDNPDADVKGGFQGIMGEDGDWQVINKQYFKLYDLVLNCPGHVYLVAEQDNVKVAKGGKGWGDDKQTMKTFGPYGVKPKGQKRLGFIPNTVLWMQKARVGEYSMTTIKDQGREEVEDAVVGDFAKDYFMKVAGWRPVA